MQKLGKLIPKVGDVGQEGLQSLIVLDAVLLAGPDDDGAGPHERHPEAPLIGLFLHLRDDL